MVVTADWIQRSRVKRRPDRDFSGRIPATNNIYYENNMPYKKETVKEFMKRGGKVKTLPYVKNYSIDYFSFGKVKPEMLSTKMVS